MTTAALGGVIEAPTLDGGRTRVTVPEGSQAGRQLRLRGKGMPVLRGSRFGDMYIELAVETPVNLTGKQKDLLKEFEKESLSNSPESQDFFDKLKSFWNDVTK
jgi:molecular chaperone DnaJ